jgi:hypothetical protein
MPKVLSEADIERVEKELRADAAAAPQDAKNVFCESWPTARKVIEALLKIVTNPILKLILQAVEEVGDLLQKLICPK